MFIRGLMAGLASAVIVSALPAATQTASAEDQPPVADTAASFRAWTSFYRARGDSQGVAEKKAADLTGMEDLYEQDLMAATIAEFRRLPPLSVSGGTAAQRRAVRKAISRYRLPRFDGVRITIERLPHGWGGVTGMVNECPRRTTADGWDVPVCPPDVALDWRHLSRGQGVPAVLTHELGHVAQYFAAGQSYPQVRHAATLHRRGNAERAVELQADCLAKARIGRTRAYRDRGGYYLWRYHQRCSAAQLSQARRIWKAASVFA